MRILAIFWQFLSLGCVGFGGPAAHIGLFRTSLVERRQWLEEGAFARLVALSQFLPGPGSSQVGFAIGCHRGGVAGGIAAFLGFTLPSFVLMFAVSLSGRTMLGGPEFAAVIHGLKLMAVVVVAHATLGMYRQFCTSPRGVAICGGTAAALLVWPGLWTQLAVLVGAALVGSISMPAEEPEHPPQGRIRWLPLVLWAGLLVAAPVARAGGWAVAMFADFFLSGSLVFGGGHVVLPLLQATVGDAVTDDRFLFGYAAAQAVPGPMFSVAGFLGAEMRPGESWLGAVVATLAVFLPGFLLVLGLQGAWGRLSVRPRVARGTAGVLAAVVGLLIAALYTPVFVSSVTSPTAMALVVVGFLALQAAKPPMVAVVVAFALAGWGLGPWL